MPDYQHILTWIGLVVIAGPLLLTVILGITSLLDIKLEEETTARLVYAATVSGFLAAVTVLVSMLVLGTRHVAIDLGAWVIIPEHYRFSIKFVFDRLSVPFVILSFVLSGTIGAFATKYMHRERGYNRFFVLYAVFVLGMVVTSLAGTIETLFAGWELVGLSSALLVTFFQERPAPARNGLWVWAVYRVSDAALLLAAVAIHHLLVGEGDFDLLFSAGTGLWPYEHSTVAAHQALLVGLLLLLAAAGKSALVPFSGWLPRAMEGPTPSSAVFYGALSVHLGVFLLLRVSPLLERSVVLCAVIVALGLATAVFAYLAGSVQTDIKSALSFASLSQVGIMVAEIGIASVCIALALVVPAHVGSVLERAGYLLRYVALVHLLGHACLRTLQFVRAPSLLQDYHTLENAIGERLPRAGSPLGHLGSNGFHARMYRLALDRGDLDSVLLEYVVVPFVRVFRWFDRLERRWTDFLSGGASRESDRVKPHFGTIEEFS
jgi:NADH-quinone oxidoreductase subunit L